MLSWVWALGPSSGTNIALCDTMCRTNRAYGARPDIGFTLIELMIVIVIVGLLSSIGLVNFISMRENAKMASCISNQKHVHEAAILHAADTNVAGNTTINVTVLTGSGLLTQEAGECPSSGTVDFDDYVIEFTTGDVSAVTCSIRGAEHLYEP
jgi:prepilin-type N-terminal cleavage/methylation domain-containing protein